MRIKKLVGINKFQFLKLNAIFHKSKIEIPEANCGRVCFPTANLELLVKQYSKIFCCARRENASLSMKTPRNQSKKSRVYVLIIVRQVARKTYPSAVHFVRYYKNLSQKHQLHL